MLNCYLICKRRMDNFLVYTVSCLRSSRELPEPRSSSAQNAELPISFPLEVMVHPLELRFKYHFSGEKPTNRLDKVRFPPDSIFKC